MRVIFRADASINIGTGHVMRCLTLAEALRAAGASCHFVTRNLPGHLGRQIAERGFGLSLLEAPLGSGKIIGPTVHAPWAGVTWQKDLDETRAAMGFGDWLVVDHYAFDSLWEEGLTAQVDRIMAIDDLADRAHVADLLLDQNLGRRPEDYDGLIPDHCQRLIGPRYALLRPEFAAKRMEALDLRVNRPPRHVLISMGGTDVVDATSKVLTAMRSADLRPDMRLTVVMGHSAPALGRVRILASEMPWPTKVLVDVVDMASLMANADFAIGASGSTTWERCCLGLPSIVVVSADNQAGAAAAMEASGAALGTGPLFAPDFQYRLVDALHRGLEPEISARMSKISAKICDGNGAMRLVELMGAAAWA